jgi:hypothetical protein
VQDAPGALPWRGPVEEGDLPADATALLAHVARQLQAGGTPGTVGIEAWQRWYQQQEEGESWTDDEAVALLTTLTPAQRQRVVTVLGQAAGADLSEQQDLLLEVFASPFVYRLPQLDASGSSTPAAAGPPGVPIGADGQPGPVLPADSLARRLFPPSIGTPDGHGFIERRSSWSWQTWSFDDPRLLQALDIALAATIVDPVITPGLVADVHRWLEAAPEHPYRSQELEDGMDDRLEVRLLGWRVLDRDPVFWTGGGPGATQFAVRAVLGVRLVPLNEPRPDQVFELDGLLRVPTPLTRRADMQPGAGLPPELTTWGMAAGDLQTVTDYYESSMDVQDTNAPGDVTATEENLAHPHLIPVAAAEALRELTVLPEAVRDALAYELTTTWDPSFARRLMRRNPRQLSTSVQVNGPEGLVRVQIEVSVELLRAAPAAPRGAPLRTRDVSVTVAVFIPGVEGAYAEYELTGGAVRFGHPPVLRWQP